MDSSKKPAGTGRRRRLPGPAGAYMEKKMRLQAGEGEPPVEPDPAEAYLGSPAWRRMLAGQGQDEEDPASLINTYNAAWANARNCPGLVKPAPALHLAIRWMDVPGRAGEDVRCQLMDRTGRLPASIHHGLMRSGRGVPALLQPGAVLVLKGPKVIWTAEGGSVVVTEHNLAAVYGVEDRTLMAVTSQELSTLAAACEAFRRERSARRAGPGGGGAAAAAGNDV